MKKIILLSSLFLFLSTGTSGQTDVSGAISSDTTWSLANSPYTVTGNILVASDVTLTIEAGVTVKINTGLYIKIQGSVVAIGTESDKITITSNETSPTKGDWDKIWLASTSTSFDGNDNYVSGTIFNHCIISYANEGLRLDDSSFYLVNSELTENNIGINFRKVINSIVDNNNFNNNNSGTSTSAGTEENGIGSFTFTKFLNNTFKNNTGHGLSFGGYGNNANNNLIKNNISINNGGNGFYFGWGDVVRGFADNTIEGNIIYNNSGNGITVGRDSNIIKKNFIVNNDGSGINISGTYIYEGLTIENNIISGNLGYGLDLTSNTNSLIRYNSILNSGGNSGNPSLGIPDSYITSNYNTITFNTIDASKNNAIELRYGPNTINNNNFIKTKGNYIFKVLTDNDSDINAENNYWGTSTESEIQAAIYDYSDDFELGAVDYTPFSNTLNTPAPISPPSNVIKSVSGSDVVINWTANAEADVAGYKLYYGDPTGYSYSTVIDLGNVTTYTVTGGEVATEYAITAYDSSIDGTDDMVDGNESWYSLANTVPELPSGVTIEAAPRKSRLNWTPSASSDINKYIIYRGTTADPTEVLTEVIDPTAVFFVDTDLTQGSNYFYRIKSVSTAGVESDFSQNYSVAIPDSWIVSLTPGPLDLFGSIQNPYNTIQAAIDQSINDDIVLVSPGTYQENIVINGKVITITTPDPTVSAETTIIDGGSTGFPTISINGNNVSSDSSLLFSGFTVQNGLSPTFDQGAGIDVKTFYPTLMLENLIIRDNISTTDAAGSFLYFTGDVFVSDVIFKNNNGDSALRAYNSSLKMSRVEFYDNTSSSSLLKANQSSVINNTIIRNNTSLGALDVDNMIILNSTVINSGNQNSFDGNSAIVNTIIGSGQFISSDTGLLEVHNSYIEDGQSSIDIFPSFLTYENNLEGDIYFTDAENLDFTLSEYSPGIGAGLNSITLYGVTYDLSSNTDLNLSDRPLPQETNIDIGAYENSLGINTHNSNIYVSVNEGSNEGSVGLETQPFQTIQAAINYAIDGDSIYVLPGTYPGGVYIINKGISFISTTPLGAIVNNNVNNSNTFTFSSDTGVFYSTITGFDINKTSTDQAYGVRATNEHYVNVYKSKISNFTYATSTGASAIQAENCLLINNAIAIYNDQCSTGSITPQLKNCTIINSTTIHAACPTISLNVFNSIVLVSDTNQNTYTSAPNFNKVITNDVNVVPQENSTWEVALDGETDIYFTDYINGDYSLQNFSPAIGFGFFPVTEDLLGNPRPVPTGSVLDIGAYESPLGEPLNGAPRFNNISAVSITEDSPLASFDITGVVDGDILLTQDLLFSVSSDNPDLFDTLEITYSQQDNIATLVHSPALNQNGTANVTVSLSDDGSGDANNISSITKSFIYDVSPINDAPTEILLSNQTIEENNFNFIVGELSTLDIDDTLFTYSFVSGPGDQDNPNFGINGSELLAIVPFDYETSTEAFIRLKVTDTGGLSFEKEFVIAITDINDAPISIDQSVTTNEDTLYIDTLTSTDQDNDPLTYIIIDQPLNGTVVLNNDQIEYTPSLNYYGVDSFTFKANDGLLDSNVANISIDVLPVNDAPTDIVLSSSSLLENTTSFIGLLTCVDPDSDDLYTFELVSGTGDTNNILFQVSNNELYNLNPFDFETQETLSIRIKAIYGNDSIEQIFTIDVINDNDINITFNIQDSYCVGDLADGQVNITEINDTSGDITFNWTGPNGFESQNQSLINVEPGIYSLELSDSFFTYQDNFTVGLLPIYSSLEICYVSGDEIDITKNRIFLNKEGNYNVAAYKILRETNIAGEYEQIGLVLPSQESYLDNESNNFIKQYKYKVVTVDNCGEESTESSVHYNTFLQANISSGNFINLNWEPYFGLDYDSFYIYRSVNGSSFEILDILPGNQTVYNDTTADVTINNYIYYVGIIVDECDTPNPFVGNDVELDRALSTTVTKSNTINIIDGTLGVSQNNFDFDIFLFPNPASEIVTVNIPDNMLFKKVSIFNNLGQLVSKFDTTTLDVEKLTSGLYYVQIETNLGIFNKSLIKE